MKVLSISYYHLNSKGGWNFNKSYVKEYYFHDSSDDDIHDFVNKLQSYEIIFIHTWNIR